MEELDISHYTQWPLKAENEILVEKSRQSGAPFNKGMPTRATINATTDCNLSCDMCRYHGQAKIPSQTLSLEAFLELSQQLFPFLKEVHPSVKGEPFLIPYFSRMVRELTRFGVKLNLTTNGVLLTPEKSKLVLPVLRDLKVSFDGATRETFERIRRGAKYERVIGNLYSFSKLREEYLRDEPNPYKPTLTLQTVLMRSNITELPAIVRLAHKLGADRVKGFHLTVYDQAYLDQSLLFNRELANKYLIEATELAHSLGMETKYQDPFDLDVDIFSASEDPSYKRCVFLWNQFTVDPDGSVRPCCHDNSPIMGNVLEDSVKDIWNNRVYQDMRKKLNSDDAYECCKNCAMQSRTVLDADSFIFCDYSKE